MYMCSMFVRRKSVQGGWNLEPLNVTIQKKATKLCCLLVLFENS